MSGVGTALRVGIIGTGWGVKVQVPKFRDAGLDVVALYSRSEDRARKLAAQLDIKHPFWDVDSLCRCNEVDLVSIVSPPHLRLDCIRKAVAAGKHILTDKPMATSASEARTMLAVLESAKPGTQNFVDFELRCTPAFLRARELISEGAIGRVNMFSGRVLASFPMFAKDAFHSHWHMRECSGGMYSAVGTHFVDAIGFLLQRQVARVSAVEQRHAERLFDENGVAKPVTAESAVSVHVEVSGESPPSCHILLSGACHGLPPENTQLIVGDTGTLQIDLNAGSMRLFRPGQAAPEEEVGPAGGSLFSDVGTPQIAVALQMACGRAAVSPYRGWRLPDPSLLATFRDGLVSQQIADAVHKSAERGGEWMTVSEF
mmetsp:Transcript_30060/g.71632  ORF Transcript_30060/g.71632 Transcript_30060/m.71632 type:complete len:372 (+) Transcript_30060:91-1206(+)